MDLPIKNGDFHSFLYVYQRVTKAGMVSRLDHVTSVERSKCPPTSEDKRPAGRPGAVNRRGFWKVNLAVGYGLPSSKRSHNYRKSPFFTGKSSINKPFSSSQTVSLPEATNIESTSTT